MITQIIKTRLATMPLQLQSRSLYFMGVTLNRSFAAPVAPKKPVAAPKAFVEPLSITELINLSQKNV